MTTGVVVSSLVTDAEPVPADASIAVLTLTLTITLVLETTDTLSVVTLMTVVDTETMAEGVDAVVGGSEPMAS